MFQSTLPRGERQNRRNLFLGNTGFNPRSRVESDKFGIFCGAFASVFQSTLPRGERLY